MIFGRSLIREIASSATATFVVLFSFMATQQTVRLLSRAVQGRIENEGVLALIGFGLLSSLPVILSLTLFISVLLTISRQYRDSEMVVWFASGQSLLAWLRPVLLFAIPLILVIAGMSFFVSPWAASKSELYSNRIGNKGDADRVAPGSFSESSNSERVIFAEALGGAEVQNVFVNTIDGTKNSILVAKRGYERVEPEGDRTLILESGTRYEGRPGSADFRIIEFERHSMKAKDKEETAALETPAKQLSWQQLRANPTRQNQGEMVWRIGIAISGFLLVLLAIPLGFVNPRVGRSVNLVFALLTFFVYLNSINVAQTWVVSGRMPFSRGWWIVHAVIAAVVLILFAKRLTVSTPWRRLKGLAR